MGRALQAFIVAVLVAATFLFIFGPVFGLRETGAQLRSRRIHEEHERRQRETREYSEREAQRSREQIERARKELFGDR